MKNYINSLPSPRRERILGFWVIVLPVVLILLIAILASSCSSAGPACHTYDHAVKVDRSKEISRQIHAQSNYKQHKHKDK
jgi:hypothetical protein